MKCPKCNYVSHDYLDSCRKCHIDLLAFKQQIGLIVLQPGVLDLIPVLAGHGGVSLLDDQMLVDADTSMSDESGSFDISLDDYTDIRVTSPGAGNTEGPAVSRPAAEHLTLELDTHLADLEALSPSSEPAVPGPSPEGQRQDSLRHTSPGHLTIELGSQDLPFDIGELGGTPDAPNSPPEASQARMVDAPQQTDTSLSFRLDPTRELDASHVSDAEQPLTSTASVEDDDDIDLDNEDLVFTIPTIEIVDASSQQVAAPQELLQESGEILEASFEALSGDVEFDLPGGDAPFPSEPVVGLEAQPEIDTLFPEGDEVPPSIAASRSAASVAGFSADVEELTSADDEFSTDTLDEFSTDTLIESPLFDLTPTGLPEVDTALDQIASNAFNLDDEQDAPDVDNAFQAVDTVDTSAGMGSSSTVAETLEARMDNEAPVVDAPDLPAGSIQGVRHSEDTAEFRIGQTLQELAADNFDDADADFEFQESGIEWQPSDDFATPIEDRQPSSASSTPQAETQEDTASPAPPGHTLGTSIRQPVQEPPSAIFEEADVDFAFQSSEFIPPTFESGTGEAQVVGPDTGEPDFSAFDSLEESAEATEAEPLTLDLDTNELTEEFLTDTLSEAELALEREEAETASLSFEVGTLGEELAAPTMDDAALISVDLPETGGTGITGLEHLTLDLDNTALAEELSRETIDAIDFIFDNNDEASDSSSHENGGDEDGLFLDLDDLDRDEESRQ